MKDIEDRSDIDRLLNVFYRKLISDDKIGYFFTEVVQLDLQEHLPVIGDFWETTLFHKTIYKGNPMIVHQNLNLKSPLRKEHFDRWVHIFCETINNNFKGEKAELGKQRAISIATVMRIKISV